MRVIDGPLSERRTPVTARYHELIPQLSSSCEAPFVSTDKIEKKNIRKLSKYIAKYVKGRHCREDNVEILDVKTTPSTYRRAD